MSLGARNGRHHVRVATFLLTLLSFASTSPVGAQSPDASLYRLFLLDGSTLVSYGEYARVSDQVVFSMPMGAVEPSSTPPLQLVTIPSASVDWTTTERYTDAVRAGHYAATRGEADFALLNSQVAWALNEIALTVDSARRLELAHRARRVLNEWGRTSYGYRAQEVAQLAGFVDEIISEIQASSGAQSFELSFVANVGPPPSMPLLPPPSLKDSVELVLTAARTTEDSASRLRLLERALSLLDDTSPDWTETWVIATRARAVSELAAERQTETAYAVLRASVLDAANTLARAADARGLEALVRQVLETDERLGHRRPNAVSALLTTLDRKLEAARRLRLARDKWTLEVGAYRAYRKQVTDVLAAWRRVGPALEDVRALAGPDPNVLASVEVRVNTARSRLADLKPPGALLPVHALFQSAFQLAAGACGLRREAVIRDEMRVAWNASSAAAGALMLFERASRDLEQLLQPPELQ